MTKQHYERRRKNAGRRREDLQPTRNKLARIYFAAGTIVSSITGLVDPNSLGYMLTTEIGPEGRWILVGLLATAILAFIDAVINDFLPSDWTFAWAARHRHLIYLAMAVIYAAFLYVAIQRGHTTMLLWRYSLDGLVAAAIAVLDVFHRYVQPRHQREAQQGNHAAEGDRQWPA